MYYHQFPNLGEILQYDLLGKIRKGIGSEYFLNCEFNCNYTTKVKGKCAYGGECRSCCVVYKVTVGDCGKAGRKNSAMECPYMRTRNSTYDAVILEKGERSQAVRRYADFTKEDVKTPLGKNRLIIS